MQTCLQTIEHAERKDFSIMDQASSNGERRRGVLRTSLRSTEASRRAAFHTPSSPARTTIALESSRPLRCPKHRSNTRVAYKEDAAGVVEGPRRDEPPTPIVEVRIDKHLLTECFPRHICRRGIPAVGGTTPLMKKQSSWHKSFWRREQSRTHRLRPKR